MANDRKDVGRKKNKDMRGNCSKKKKKIEAITSQASSAADNTSSGPSDASRAIVLGPKKIRKNK